eukprot:255228-Amphidinium_carterae.1
MSATEQYSSTDSEAKYLHKYELQSMNNYEHELVNSCLEGPYDCVCGDREKLRGTYKEFVLFDSEDTCS